jgi:hypothetical protein
VGPTHSQLNPQHSVERCVLLRTSNAEHGSDVVADGGGPVRVRQLRPLAERFIDLAQPSEILRFLQQCTADGALSSASTVAALAALATVRTLWPYCDCGTIGAP